MIKIERFKSIAHDGIIYWRQDMVNIDRKKNAYQWKLSEQFAKTEKDPQKMRE